MTVRMGYDFAKTGDPKKLWTFWGEEEQRNERAFRACTETSDMKFVTTRAKQRRGETPGQERHSGKTAKAFLTLSLLRAHFYTGVFHTSYRALCEADSRQLRSCVCSASLRSEQGAAPLALFHSYPCDLVSAKRFCKSFRTHKAENTNKQRRFHGIQT